MERAPQGVVLPRHLPGDGKAPGQESLPTSPAKSMGDERAATRLIPLCVILLHIDIYTNIYMATPKPLVVTVWPENAAVYDNWARDS